MAKNNPTIIHRNRWYWGEAAYIVVDGGLGFCKVTIDDTDVEDGIAWLGDVSVHTSARGQGLGNELLTEAEHLAVQMGAKYLYLWADPDNWPIKWYIRHGFEMGRLMTKDGMPVLVKAIK